MHKTKKLSLDIFRSAKHRLSAIFHAGLRLIYALRTSADPPHKPRDFSANFPRIAHSGLSAFDRVWIRRRLL